MKGVYDGLPMRDRDPAEVDRVIGKRLLSPIRSNNVDFSQCPLAQRYPDWESYYKQLADERLDAATECRPVHPAAAPPPKRLGTPKFDPPPWHTGSSVGDINKSYGSKD